jgi:hypothetical protein
MSKSSAALKNIVSPNRTTTTADVVTRNRTRARTPP